MPARPAGAQQPVFSGLDRGPHHQVAELHEREIHDAAEPAPGRDVLERHPAHAGGVEDRDFVAAVLQGGLQRLHVMHGARSERGHADDGAVSRRRLCGPRGAEHGAGRLAERRLADGIQPVEAARPEDHLDIRREPVRRDQRREGNRRHDIFRYAERQHPADIERRVGPHGAAEHDRAGKLSLPVQVGGQDRGAPGHDLHGGVLVAGLDRGPVRAAARCRDIVLRIIDRRVRLAQHADVHGENAAAERPDALRHVGELRGLRIVGPHDENCPVGHRDASFAASRNRRVRPPVRFRRRHHSTDDGAARDKGPSRRPFRPSRRAFRPSRRAFRDGAVAPPQRPPQDEEMW